MTNPTTTMPATPTPARRVLCEHRHEPQQSHAPQPTADRARPAIALPRNTTAATTTPAKAAAKAGARSMLAPPSAIRPPAAITTTTAARSNPTPGHQCAHRANTERHRKEHKGDNASRPRHHHAVAARLDRDRLPAIEVTSHPGTILPSPPALTATGHPPQSREHAPSPALPSLTG